MAQSRERLFVINVHKSVCHYSYVENICFLVCEVLSSSIDVSVDGSAGPVRETVEEIRHYPKSVMTTLDNAQKLKLPEPSKEKAGFRIGFYYRFFRATLLCGISNKFRHRGLRAASQLVGGFQRIPEAASKQKPFQKKIRNYLQNCGSQLQISDHAPVQSSLIQTDFLTGRQDLPGTEGLREDEERVGSEAFWEPSFLLQHFSCRCEIFGNECQGEGVFGHSACPSSSN